MVRQIVVKQSEKKYFDDNFTGRVAMEGATVGSSGHALLLVDSPASGTAYNQKIGNKINISSIGFKCSLVGATQANTQRAIPVTMYIVQFKEGGTFLIDHFLDLDPTSGTKITTRSFRNVDRFSEFRVLAKKDITIGPDHYQAGTGDWGEIDLALKCNVSQRFNTGGTSPLQNQLAVVIVCGEGSIQGGTDLSYLLNMRYFYTDA